MNKIKNWFAENGFEGSVPRIIILIAFLGAIFGFIVLAKADTSYVEGGAWFFVGPILTLLGLFILDIFMPILGGALIILGIPFWMFILVMNLFGVALWGGGVETTPYIQFLPIEWLILFIAGVMSILWGIKLRREKRIQKQTTH
jgi:hypothetical protein